MSTLWLVRSYLSPVLLFRVFTLFVDTRHPSPSSSLCSTNSLTLPLPRLPCTVCRISVGRREGGGDKGGRFLIISQRVSPDGELGYTTAPPPPSFGCVLHRLNCSCSLVSGLVSLTLSLSLVSPPFRRSVPASSRGRSSPHRNSSLPRGNENNSLLDRQGICALSAALALAPNLLLGFSEGDTNYKPGVARALSLCVSVPQSTPLLRFSYADMFFPHIGVRALCFVLGG